MSKKLRIGIIGTGGIARAHISAYKKLEYVEIAGVADVIPGKAFAFAKAEGLTEAASFDSHTDLLRLDLDGVSICTPNVSHHVTTVDSLRAGKHVLLEKPMSVTLQEGIEMTQAAKESGKMLTLGFQPRYDPNMKLLQTIVQSGRLGNVYYVETEAGVVGECRAGHSSVNSSPEQARWRILVVTR